MPFPNPIYLVCPSSLCYNDDIDGFILLTSNIGKGWVKLRGFKCKRCGREIIYDR